ncbi:MAG TPA: DUF3810 domain-containing protein [Candidatus Bathyarchaeia archaeon]|nr:DUF3810 domain-containing protein [Candidatus Bathyarchaeia archaeon]
MRSTPPPSNPPAFDKDRRLRIRWRLVVMLAGVIMVALAQVLDATPRVVDAVYSEGVGPWIGLTLARLSNLAPFSLVEVVAGLLVLCYGVAVAASLYHVARRRRRLANALACGLLRTGTAAALIIAFFYAGWGFSFSRPKMIARLGWQSFLTAKANDELADELAAICEGLVQAANNDYMRTFNAKDAGVPSDPPLAMAELDAAIEEGYRRLTVELNLKHHFAIPRGRIKPVAASSLLSRLLIMGFYSPWTGESQYNTQMPGCNLPQVVAHEKAHQRCITSEDEANFFGILACVLSDVPYVRYSGYLAAQQQLLNELHGLDPDCAHEIAEKRHPGVQRDREASRNFVMKHRGILSQASRAMNDTYLKANRVKEGVLSYDMDTQLIIAFTRARGSGWYDSRPANTGQQPPATPNPG